MLNNRYKIVFFIIIISLLFSEPPKWIKTGSDSKNWVGVGMASISDSPPGSDLAQLAQINAAAAIASQISIDIMSEVKIERKLESQGNKTTSSSSIEKKLAAKVNQTLKNVSFPKRDNDNKYFYCLAKLNKKKYYKELSNRRNVEISKALEKLEKVKSEDFTGQTLTYLDEALYGLLEFELGIENDFVTIDPPVITLKDCPDSGILIEGNISKEQSSKNDNYKTGYTSSIPDIEEIEEDSIAKAKRIIKENDLKRGGDLLEEMRKRIYSYTEENLYKEDKKPSKADSEDVINLPEISETEDECKTCLSKDSCDNPFDEECECAEICGEAIQEEICEENEINLVQHLKFLLDDYVKRINFSSHKFYGNIIDVKFGTQHNRLKFRSTDSYLDHIGAKSLDELIAQRSSLIYKSFEWGKVQNLINQLLNSNIRHDQGIESLPLFNIPVSISIGDNHSYSENTDKGGNFNVDFPKYVYGSTPYIDISLDLSTFKGYLPLYPPAVKIPINIEPLVIHIEIVEENEWNDDLGWPLKPFIVEEFSSGNFTFTDDKSAADNYIYVESVNIIKPAGSMMRSNHTFNLSFSDNKGDVVYQELIKSKKAVTGFGDTNDDLKNLAYKSKDKLAKKLKTELINIYNSIMNK